MKKKSLIILLCLCCVFSLVACGKTEEEKEMEEIAEDLGFTDDELDELEELFEDESFDSKENSVEDNQEKEYKKYEALEEWKDVEISDAAVQIDDQLYIGGGTVKDILEQIDSSEIEYSYDVNLDKLVQYSEDIVVYRDGVKWFKISTYNLSADTGILADNVVCGVYAEEAAYPYSRFIDGRSYDELLEMTYKDVLDLRNSLFPEDKWFYSERTTSITDENGEKHDAFEEEYSMSSVDIIQPRFLWTGYDVGKNDQYFFYVNCDSGKVEKFRHSNWGLHTQETEAIPYTSMADINEEELNEFIMNAEKALVENTGAVSNELDSIYLFEDSDRLSLLFSYEITKDDGSEKYAYIKFFNVGRKPIGGIRYDEYFEWNERNIPEGAYVVTDSLLIELLDEMKYDKSSSSNDKEVKFEWWESFSDFTEEELNALTLQAETLLEKNREAVTNELNSIYLYEYQGGFCLCFSYKITKADNSEKYAWVNLYNIGYTNSGEISATSFSSGETDLSEGAYTIKDDWGIRLIDTLEYRD